MTKPTTLRAFHGDPGIKAHYLNRLEEHHRQGQIAHGTGQNNIELSDGTFRDGSPIGWTVHSNDYTAYVRELGIARNLAWLEETIFGEMPAASAPQFAVDFLEVIPIGADLSLVVPQFLHWLLMDKEDGLIRFAKTNQVTTAIQNAGDLLSRFLLGEIITMERWQSAKEAAKIAGRESANEAAYGTDSTYTFATTHAAQVAYWASSGTAHIGVDGADTYDGEAASAAGCATHAYAYNFDPHSDANFDEAAHEAAGARQAAKLLQLLREAPTSK